MNDHNQTEALPERLRSELKDAAAALVKRAFAKQVPTTSCYGPLPLEPLPALEHRFVRGWSFHLETYRNNAVDHWRLSAMLSPQGRGSNNRDWQVLGFVVAAIQEQSGHPTDIEPPGPLTPFETTPPNKIHHWAWHGDGSPLAPGVEDFLRQIIAHTSSTE